MVINLRISNEYQQNILFKKSDSMGPKVQIVLFVCSSDSWTVE